MSNREEEEWLGQQDGTLDKKYKGVMSKNPSSQN